MQGGDGRDQFGRAGGGGGGGLAKRSCEQLLVNVITHSVSPPASPLPSSPPSAHNIITRLHSSLCLGYLRHRSRKAGPAKTPNTSLSPTTTLTPTATSSLSKHALILNASAYYLTSLFYFSPPSLRPLPLARFLTAP